jgi:CDP-glycerol glycerophosphotransferase (TagB/SpsB family)
MHFKWRNFSNYSLESYPFKINQVLCQLIEKNKIRNIEKLYKRLSVKIPNNDIKYVLFAPNYQPEATTLPSALHYSDTLLCLKILRSKLPKHIYIVYKEHEDIFNISLEGQKCRSSDYYSDILKIENILIADRGSNQIDLIDNAEFIVIQTSNIGLEASIRGKKVVAFGSTWFNKFAGVIDWADFENSSDYNNLFESSKPLNSYFLKNINQYTVRLEDIDNSLEVVAGLKELILCSLDKSVI